MPNNLTVVVVEIIDGDIPNIAITGTGVDNGVVVFTAVIIVIIIIITTTTITITTVVNAAATAAFFNATTAVVVRIAITAVVVAAVAAAVLPAINNTVIRHRQCVWDIKIRAWAFTLKKLFIHIYVYMTFSHFTGRSGQLLFCFVVFVVSMVCPSAKKLEHIFQWWGGGEASPPSSRNDHAAAFTVTVNTRQMYRRN